MKLGVVIPTLDEAEVVEAALSSVVAGDPGTQFLGTQFLGTQFGSGRGAGSRGGAPGLAARDTAIEIVVVDGGSRDDTCQRARTWGATAAAGGPLETRVIELAHDPSAGRSRQLQAGFEACGGDAVLFLHADTRLPAGWTTAVRGALSDPRVVGGAFRFRFEPDPSGRTTLGLRLIEWGVRLRVALFALPYGDQAIFARREALEAIGGVPQAPLMEDLDLVAALKRRGRLVRLAAPATTSSRRYREAGVLRTFLRNLVALAAWRLGVDRGRVAAWYRGSAGAPS